MVQKTTWAWKINLRCHFCQESDEVYYRDNPLGNLKPCDTCFVSIEGKLTAVLICEDCFKEHQKTWKLEN